MSVDRVPMADLLDAVLAGRVRDAPLVTAVLAYDVLDPTRGAPPRASRVTARSPSTTRSGRCARRILVKVGVPKEVKNHEYRVAITPVGVHELVAHGHEVVVQKDAGVGSSIPDEEYVAAGAKIIDQADDVWADAEMVLKVKEPVAEEYHRMREGQVLFTYLHLAADRPLTEELIKREVTGDRLRDRAAALGRAAAALPDVRGRRLSRAPGRRALADEGRGWPRGADGRRRRCRERQGGDHRCRRLRPERRQHRARHGRRRDPARHRPRQAADVVLALQQPGARPGILAGWPSSSR